MKKLGAETIIIVMLIPILLAFGGYVHSKVTNNSEKIISLESESIHSKEDIQEIKQDVKELLRRVR